MFIDVADPDISWRRLYQLVIGFVVPRPIALISSLSESGVGNLAPFSFYNWVSVNPPVLVVGPALNRHGAPKDTLANIAATGEFVVATVTDALAERMNLCGKAYPPEVNEFDESGLTPRSATVVKPPLVAESPVNVECRRRHIESFGTHPGAGRAIFGDVVAIHIDDAILDREGLPDAALLRAVGRMGGTSYARTTDRFDLPALR